MTILDDIKSHLGESDSQPPIHLWHPDFSGEIDIKIAANGDWFHDGDLIKRKQLVKLFASILRREDDCEYYLVTPVEKWRIRVEDTALQIVDMEVYGVKEEQKIVFITNVDTKVLLSSDSPLQVQTRGKTAEPKPVVSLEHNLTAKLSRSVFYRLVELAELDENEKNMIVVSDGVVFNLGSVVE